jgi:predicted DNA-binding protein (UPF0251 family)
MPHKQLDVVLFWVYIHIMSRPKCNYTVAFCPKIKKFIPEGACASTGIVLIGAAEAEALRLKHIEDLSQTAAAAKMKISQSSFQRVLQAAHKKISEALIEGKFITIADSKSAAFSAKEKSVNNEARMVRRSLYPRRRARTMTERIIRGIRNEKETK